MDVQALFFLCKNFSFSVRGFFCRFLKQERSCSYFGEVFSVLLQSNPRLVVGQRVFPKLLISYFFAERRKIKRVLL